jgi:hypothetical protein
MLDDKFTIEEIEQESRCQTRFKRNSHGQLRPNESRPSDCASECYRKKLLHRHPRGVQGSEKFPCSTLRTGRIDTREHNVFSNLLRNPASERDNVPVVVDDGPVLGRVPVPPVNFRVRTSLRHFRDRSSDGRSRLQPQ